jgi:hypothetical protein
VLQVGVHHHHDLALRGLQAGGERGLLAEVARQLQRAETGAPRPLREQRFGVVVLPSSTRITSQSRLHSGSTAARRGSRSTRLPASLQQGMTQDSVGAPRKLMPGASAPARADAIGITAAVGAGNGRFEKASNRAKLPPVGVCRIDTSHHSAPPTPVAR